MTLSPFTIKTQSIIDSLNRIDCEHPILDKPVIAACFDEHFRLLNLPTMPIVWMSDPKSGYDYVIKKGSASESAAWSAAWLNCKSKAAITYGGIWYPFLKARHAGLWLYWVMADEVVCVATPSLSLDNNQLHNESGPAVSWPSGESYFFYRGIQINEAILNRDYLWQDIDKQTNSEVRRVMMTLYSTERYIKDSGIKPVHSDDYGTLYRRDDRDGTVFMAVKVVNSTVEPDGSFKDYWLRVNHKLYGGLKTAHAAVASTWRTKDGKLAFSRPEDYCPAFET